MFHLLQTAFFKPQTDRCLVFYLMKTKSKVVVVNQIKTSEPILSHAQAAGRRLIFFFVLFFFFFHSHPSDLKHRFHRHQSSTSLHGSFNHNHIQDTNLPLVTEEHDENSDGKGPVYDPKQDVFVTLFVSLRDAHLSGGFVLFSSLLPTRMRTC